MTTFWAGFGIGLFIGFLFSLGIFLYMLFHEYKNYPGR